MYSGVPHTMPGLVIDGVASVSRTLREPEVDDLHEVGALARRLEDDVLGLQIAVDDPEVVRLAERREHLAEDVDDAAEGERPFFVERRARRSRPRKNSMTR